MNINFEKTPNSIFDWVENFSFTELNDLQKREVLLYLSEEEYEGMYHSFKSLKSVLAKESSISNLPEKKNRLLNHFDDHKDRKKQTKIKSLIVWQAAAVLLMMLSGWLFYHVFDLQRSENILQIASTDTVYVAKEITAQPELIHDTVYLYKESEGSGQKNGTVVKSAQNNDPKQLNESGNLPLIQLENLNSPKGNSMKDDSLLKKFSFVAM